MPHSGGGGSHGGGSHGGSHGGSSSRSSRTYFPGARRYRRHYNDGRPDEYIYSNSRPQKTSLVSIITILLFGGLFSGMMFFSIRQSTPKKLTENYDRPDTYVIDNIDILDEEDELDEVLEEFNDQTGICPVIYTMYTEDYAGSYADLESFAYDEYVDNWSDERHYLVVFAIPEDQVVAYKNGNLEVPDYEFEIMMGDDTDPIISDNIESSVVDTLYNGFERGQDPDQVFLNAFELLIDKTEARLDNKGVTVTRLIPIAVVLLVFALPVITMIKAYNRDKHVEIEEVPLTESDNEFMGQYRSSFAGSPQTLADMPESTSTVIKVISLVFMAPFVIIGLSMTFTGLGALIKGGDPSAVFRLIFGLIWSAIVLVSLISMMKAFGKMKKKTGGEPLTADYPKADMPHADYPQADYPSQEYGAVSHDACHSTHEEDEDSIRKGYE